MMVFFKTMVQRKRTNAKGKQDHTSLERFVIYYIDSEQGKAGKKKRKQGAMNSTGKGGGNANSIPVNSCFHEVAKIN